METAHGSAKMSYYGSENIADLIEGGGGLNRFILGANHPYDVPYQINPKIGETVAIPDGHGRLIRLDNRNTGTSWIPGKLPGMAVCFGSTQSGKDAGLIIPNLLRYGGNVFVNDPKGAAAYLTSEFRGRPIEQGGLGHKQAICDPFDEVNRAYASRNGDQVQISKYNPLGDLDPNSMDFGDEVGAVREAVSVRTSSIGRKDFFEGGGDDLLDGIIAAIVLTSDPGRASLRAVRHWLQMNDQEFEAATKAFCEEFPQSFAAKKLRAFTVMNKTRSSVLATAKQHTDFLDSEALLRYMEPAPGEPTFSFSEMSTGALDVFLVLPGTHTELYSPWSRMMVNKSLRAALRERKARKELPIAYFLNEAGTCLGPLEMVAQAYGLSAGMGVVVWSFYQSISQIERDYPTGWEDFIGNSACVQVVAVGDQKTANYFSKYMGTETVTVTNPGSSQTEGGRGGSTTTSTSTQKIARPLMTPDEIRHMGADEMLVIYPRIGPVRQYKLRYFAEARFNGMYRFDPYHKAGYPDPIPDPYEMPDGTKGYQLLGKARIGLWVLVVLSALWFIVAMGHPLLPVLFFGALLYGSYWIKKRLPVPMLYVIHPDGVAHTNPYISSKEELLQWGEVRRQAGIRNHGGGQ